MLNDQIYEAESTDVNFHQSINIDQYCFNLKNAKPKILYKIFTQYEKLLNGSTLLFFMFSTVYHKQVEPKIII